MFVCGTRGGPRGVQNAQHGRSRQGSSTSLPFPAGSMTFGVQDRLGEEGWGGVSDGVTYLKDYTILRSILSYKKYTRENKKKQNAATKLHTRH